MNNGLRTGAGESISAREKVSRAHPYDMSIKTTLKIQLRLTADINGLARAFGLVAPCRPCREACCPWRLAAAAAAAGRSPLGRNFLGTACSAAWPLCPRTAGNLAAPCSCSSTCTPRIAAGQAPAARRGPSRFVSPAPAALHLHAPWSLRPARLLGAPHRGSAA